MAQFDYEHFDYEKEIESIRKEVKKPNILVCGGTGVGKSSLVNKLLNVEESEGAKVGKEGIPETRGVHKFSTENSTVNLYDSEGYEIGENKISEYERDVLGFIDKKMTENPGDMSEQIHEVWYCVSGANKKFFDFDKSVIEKLRNKKIPVMVIITKVDEMDEEELTQLKDAIARAIPGIDCFTFSTNPENVAEAEPYIESDEIIQWAVDKLDESLRGGFIASVKNGISVKKVYAITNIVPRYMALAAGAVATANFINVPFSDSVPLMALQTKMCLDIVNNFGVLTDFKAIAGELVGANLVSYVGKTIATQLLGIIPWVGNAVKITVNTVVAATITGTLGLAMSCACSEYLKLCVDSNGSANIPFAEYFTKEKFAEWVRYAEDHRKEFGLDEIVKSITKKH